MPNDPQADPKQKLRWYRLTPGRLLLLLLLAEGALLLSERWFPKGYAVLFAIAAVAVTMVLMLLWFSLALLFRWRYQFSIRSLLVLTVAVAIPCSWMAVEMKRAREQKNAVAGLFELKDTVYCDFRCWFGALLLPVEPSAPSFLRALLGDDFFENINSLSIHEYGPSSLTPVTDHDLKHIEELKDIEILDLSLSEITDAGLEHLKGLKQLRTLYITCPKVTDSGLKNLYCLNELRTIDLHET